MEEKLIVYLDGKGKIELETLSNIESEYFYGALDKMGYKADFSK